MDSTRSSTSTPQVPALQQHSALCSLDGCNNVAVFVFDGDAVAAYCRVHQPVEPVEAQTQPCFFKGCLSRVSHGWRHAPGTLSSCSAHKQLGMVQMRGVPCEFPDCQVNPAYALEGETQGRSCMKHMSSGMVFVNSPRCCGVPNCQRPAIWRELADSSKCVCREHRRTGVRYAQAVAICAAKDCFREPCYGLASSGMPVFCPDHKAEGMAEVRPQTCATPGCTKIPAYGMDGKREMCRDHKRAAMTCAVLTCESPLCNKNPSFAPRGETRRRFCKRHAAPGMVNVYYKYCDVERCPERASFEAGRRLRCLKHCEPGMKPRINICRVEGGGCTRQSSYGPEGGKPVLCTLHKAPGMVQVRTKTCKHEGCEKIPSYGFPCKSREYCKPHALEGMVYSAGSRCRFRGCSASGVYNYPGVRGGSFCNEHKEEGMMDTTPKKCEVTGCKYAAHFGDTVERTRRFCARHKLSGMLTYRELWPRPGSVPKASQTAPTSPPPDRSGSEMSGAAGGVRTMALETVLPPPPPLPPLLAAATQPSAVAMSSATPTDAGERASKNDAAVGSVSLGAGGAPTAATEARAAGPVGPEGAVAGSCPSGDDDGTRDGGGAAGSAPAVAIAPRPPLGSELPPTTTAPMGLPAVGDAAAGASAAADGGGSGAGVGAGAVPLVPPRNAQNPRPAKRPRRDAPGGDDVAPAADPARLVAALSTTPQYAQRISPRGAGGSMFPGPGLSYPGLAGPPGQWTWLTAGMASASMAAAAAATTAVTSGSGGAAALPLPPSFTPFLAPAPPGFSSVPGPAMDLDSLAEVAAAAAATTTPGSLGFYPGYYPGPTTTTAFPHASPAPPPPPAGTVVAQVRAEERSGGGGAGAGTPGIKESSAPGAVSALPFLPGVSSGASDGSAAVSHEAPLLPLSLPSSLPSSSSSAGAPREAACMSPVAAAASLAPATLTVPAAPAASSKSGEFKNPSEEKDREDAFLASLVNSMAPSGNTMSLRRAMMSRLKNVGRTVAS